MAINRRALLRGLGPAVALPYLLRSRPAQAVAPTLELLGDPIELGVDQPGGKRGVSLAALNGGNCVATWINTRSATDVRAFAQKLHRNGSEASAPIQLGGGSLTDGIPAFNAAAVAFPDNTSLILFSAARNGSDSDFNIYAQRMSATFHKVGSAKQVNSSGAGAQTGVLAAILANGNVQVVWESAAPDFSSSTIRGRIIKPDGDPVTPERTLIQNPHGFNTPRSMATAATDEAAARGPADGAVLSYSEVAPGGESFLVRNILQPIGTNMPQGTARLFPRTQLDRCFGSIETVFIPFSAQDEYGGYRFKPTAMGDITEVEQIEINFGSTPAVSDLVSLRTDPNYRGCPKVVRIKINGLKYALGFFRTESATQNTMTTLLMRPSKHAVLRRLVTPFSATFLTVDSAVRIKTREEEIAEIFDGITGGEDPFNDRAYVARILAHGG